MEKEDILKKAQKENLDERKEEFTRKSFNVGWIATTVVILALMLMRISFNELFIDYILILSTHSAAASFYQYYKMPEKKVYLITGILFSIAFIIGFISLLSSYGIY